MWVYCCVKIETMSKANKRKHVLNELTQDDYAPPSSTQQIVRILSSRGNNLHEVQPPTGPPYLVSMPVKFRRNVWVKRNDYVLVEPIAEGDKVKGEIVRVLTSDHVKYYKKDNVWPAEFGDKKVIEADADVVFVNTNRQMADDEVDSTSDSDESD